MSEIDDIVNMIEERNSRSTSLSIDTSDIVWERVFIVFPRIVNMRWTWLTWWERRRISMWELNQLGDFHTGWMYREIEENADVTAI
jgi:hypothetical protein